MRVVSASARIAQRRFRRALTCGAARSADSPGVLSPIGGFSLDDAVWVASAKDVQPIPLRAARPSGMEPFRQPILAQDRVRYVGDPIAVVFAENAYLAEDAASS